jgi:hypothetical protein
MRSGQTFFCAACSLRFEPAERCPACGREAVDLRDPQVRRDILPRLRRQTLDSRIRARLTLRPGCIVALIVTGIVVATLGAMVAGAIFGGGLWGMLAYIAVPVVLTLIWALRFPDLHERNRQPEVVMEDVPIRLREPPSADAHAIRILFHGQVDEAADLVLAPLSGEPCVAYRLVGQVGKSPIDEGEAAPFVLRTDSERIEVDPRPATVALSTPEPEPYSEIGERLRDFLRDRGAHPLGRSVVLAEARLERGDAVRVESSVLDVQRPDGYRGTRDAKLLAEQSGSPLIIESEE